MIKIQVQIGNTYLGFLILSISRSRRSSKILMEGCVTMKVSQYFVYYEVSFSQHKMKIRSQFRQKNPNEKTKVLRSCGKRDVFPFVNLQ